MPENMYNAKKRKKQLSSTLLIRNVEIKNIFLISTVFNKSLKTEKKSSHRLVRSAFLNVSLETFKKNHLVKVENHINCFSSCEKFDLLMKSKTKLAICSIYYKKFIFVSRKLFVINSLFWILIQVKLISILTFKEKLSSSNG